MSAMQSSDRQVSRRDSADTKSAVFLCSAQACLLLKLLVNDGMVWDNSGRPGEKKKIQKRKEKTRGEIEKKKRKT
jgi:hypothetical protein